ncbi:hypothetical protein [Niastella populi]|nr:hypothetical protein [Niastella populi]
MHKVYGGQLWMRVKIGLVLGIFVIRIFYSRNIRQLKKRPAGETNVPFTDIKKKIALWQLVQVAFVAGIIILSVCRFN